MWFMEFSEQENHLLCKYVLGKIPIHLYASFSGGPWPPTKNCPKNDSFRHLNNE